MTAADSSVVTTAFARWARTAPTDVLRARGEALGSQVVHLELRLATARAAFDTIVDELTHRGETP